MADSALFKALMGDEYSYTPKESLSGALATGIGKSLPTLVNPYGSTGSNLAAVLGGSLLAGLFGYSAKREAEQKNAEMMPVMMDLLQAKDTGTIADILKTSPYGQRLSPIGISRMSALEEAQAKREAAALERQQALGDFATKQQIRDKFIKGRRIPQSDKAPVIPAQIRNQYARITGGYNDFMDLANKIEKIASTPEFIAAKNMSAFGNNIKSEIQQSVSLFAQSRSGLAYTDKQEKILGQAAVGDWTNLTPKQVVNTLRNAAKRELNFGNVLFETSQMKPEDALAAGKRAAETGTKVIFAPQQQAGAQTPTAPVTGQSKVSPPKRADYQSAAEFLAAVKAWRGQ
jgi:hypothetical protein